VAPGLSSMAHHPNAQGSRAKSPVLGCSMSQLTQLTLLSCSKGKGGNRQVGDGNVATARMGRRRAVPSALGPTQIGLAAFLHVRSGSGLKTWFRYQLLSQSSIPHAAHRTLHTSLPLAAEHTKIALGFKNGCVLFYAHRLVKRPIPTWPARAQGREGPAAQEWHGGRQEKAHFVFSVIGCVVLGTYFWLV
jgi:hypothetical protein